MVPLARVHEITKLPLKGALDFYTSLGNKKLRLEPEAVVVEENDGLVVIVSVETALRTEIV
jgi:hypothetical protein